MCGPNECQIFIRVQPYIAKLNSGMERSVFAQDGGPQSLAGGGFPFFVRLLQCLPRDGEAVATY
jgi:hypothetical protein